MTDEVNTRRSMRLLERAMSPGHCPLLDRECIRDDCSFWIPLRRGTGVYRACAIPEIALRLHGDDE